MQQTLQLAHTDQSHAGFCPIFLSKIYLHEKRMNNAVYAIEVFCPKKNFFAVEHNLLMLLGDSFTYTYLPGMEVFRIEPYDKVFQFLYNQIEACTNTKQLESCEKIMHNIYGKDGHPEILSFLINKTKQLCNKTTS